jgi:protein-S-isoprenylcysteine O-methyltransferase Ste14
MRIFEIFPLVSFLILVLMIIGRFFSLKKKDVPVSSKSKKNIFVRFFLYPFFLLVFHLLIFELTKPAFHISISVLPVSISKNLADLLFLKFAGTILITISLIFMGLTLKSFNKSLRFGMDSKNLGKLITTGTFSVSRNPFFVSILLYFIGIVLLIPNIFFIAIAISTVVSIHLFILKEEKFLKENYDKEYKNYAQKTRRYF